MNRKLASLILIVGWAGGSLAQSSGTPTNSTQCQLSVAQSPAIRGLRIGMSAEQLLSLFPAAGNDSDTPDVRAILEKAPQQPNYGLATLFFPITSYPVAQRFSGVSNVSATVFDNKVISFKVDYAGVINQYPWRSVDQFLEKAAAVYKLPKIDAWRDEGSWKVLECDGFQVKATINGGCCPSVQVESPVPRQQIEARREADWKKVRDAFVP